MFRRFRADDRESEEIYEAARRNDAAFAAFRDALHRLLEERNRSGEPATEREH